MKKVKLLNSTLSRTENGQRVTYSKGDTFKATEKELESFRDNLEVIGEVKEDKRNEQQDTDKFTREELKDKNVTGEDGLRSLASDLDISDYNNKKKKKLIEAILEAQEGDK